MEEIQDAQYRFWKRVNKTDSCWLWTGTPNLGGYGSIAVNRKSILVHRFSYMLAHGEIPEGLEIDHLCRVRLCVNPHHLEAVTHTENARRATGSRNLTTTCKRGHEYTVENTGRRFNKRDKAWQRYCKKCVRDRWHEYYKELFKDEPGLLVQYD